MPIPEPPRRVRRRCSVLLLATLLALCTACVSSAPPHVPADADREPSRQLMVVLRPMHPDLWQRTAHMLAVAYGLQPLVAWEMRSIDAFCVVYRLEPRHDQAALTRKLQADSRVELVQPQQGFHLLAVQGPGDPYAHLQTGARALHVRAAHRYADGRGVRIAIVDTGVDFTHPDLDGRIRNAVNFVAGGEASFTRDRHGTAIAGIVAANEDNRRGIIGVAPRAELLALKACREQPAFDGAQCDSYSLSLALDYAILHHAQVINLSLAGPSDELLARLIRSALEQGIVVVAAIDPSSAHGLSFPASVPGVLAVAASDTRPAANANPTEPEPPPGVLSAPGFEILTTQPEGRYDFVSGSSMAAAHASGVAALLLQLQPKLEPQRVAALMRGEQGPAVEIGRHEGPAEIDACGAVVRLRGTGDCDLSGNGAERSGVTNL
jgi:subtilisin family serine protease